MLVLQSSKKGPGGIGVLTSEKGAPLAVIRAQRSEPSGVRNQASQREGPAAGPPEVSDKADSDCLKNDGRVNPITA